MAAKTISTQIYDITDLDTADIATAVLTDTYIPMAVANIEALAPDWGYTVTSDTTGDVLMDRAVAEWAACYILDEKGLTPYDPETGQVIREHCDKARRIILDVFGVMDNDGVIRFPSQIADKVAYSGGVRLRMER